nr:hypothetical protein [Candidatus Sigynarchaeota archaeon]
MLALQKDDQIYELLSEKTLDFSDESIFLSFKGKRTTAFSRGAFRKSLNPENELQSLFPEAADHA